MTLEPSSPLPLYHQLERVLAERPEAPGMKVPARAATRVTRVVIRRAQMIRS